MKKIFLSLLFSVITILAFAQGARIGLEGGLNLAGQSYSYSPGDAKTLTAFHAGIIVDVSSTNFAFQPGVLYSAKGQNMTTYLADQNDQYTIPEKQKIQLNYIELPFNFLYRINASKSVSVNLGGGPYLGVLVSATSASNGQTNQVDVGSSGNLTNSYRTLDYGINFVAAIEFSNSFMIKTNYSTGLADISHTSAGVHNHVFGLSLAYLFD